MIYCQLDIIMNEQSKLNENLGSSLRMMFCEICMFVCTTDSQKILPNQAHKPSGVITRYLRWINLSFKYRADWLKNENEGKMCNFCCFQPTSQTHINFYATCCYTCYQHLECYKLSGLQHHSSGIDWDSVYFQMFDICYFQKDFPLCQGHSHLVLKYNVPV